MMRVVSLYLPRWPTDRLRRQSGDAMLPADKPLVLIGRDGRRRAVTAIDAQAQALGLSVGMALAKAQALVPGLVVMDADKRGDEAALERLALWALRFSPIVMADPPDGLVIDTTGADHLHGGEAVMLTAMVQRFAAAGIEARAAIADTRGAAHAFARFIDKATVVVPSGQTVPLLRRLPLAALRLDARTVAGLRTLGFERIGDLLDQPRAPLTLRFGPDIGRRIDEALGQSAEPIEPVRSPELPQARRVFGEPIGAPETIGRFIGRLVAALCADLETRGLGARRLDLLFTRVDASMQAMRVGLAQPVRDARRLNRLLCDRIEKVDPGFGIETMTLVASATEALEHRQTISSLIEEAEPDVSDLVDVLANRVGECRIYRYAPVASDVPERSAVRVPALSPQTGSGWSGAWPRPPRLLPRPEPIETMALLPDHPPVFFVWRGVRRRVRHADGPERIFGEWWKRDGERNAVRDYFRVEDETGERYWIFRAGDGEDTATGSHDWFLHGVFG
ncbi:DNA polymerase Y family protein [Rhizobiaceae bacterium BDR2-2]|uniref:DNA-directed DNA polymerase n=1 Tax=Ectorhizobium quercum TaxID=2965071 RepID=A0AAE3SWZ1_9HYPH|nr:DNA polymerase Y family protein [Ectorhizobium quercum]MCX8999697.1 DNA polymerase Y family protein [Ectorhizobium quercum]